MLICMPDDTHAVAYHFQIMPLSLANLFRSLIVLALALHVFYMYSLARSVIGGFGFDLGVTATAMLFSLIMLLPLIWAVTLPDWPEIYTRQIRGRRWFAAGRCAGCGYVVAGCGTTCSECGMVRAAPRPYAVNVRTIRLFVVINLLAWLLGSAAGEIWAAEDERTFVREVEARLAAGREDDYARPRRWPAGSTSLMYTTSDGLTASARSHP